QNVFPLRAGGALKLTTALWYTPSGRSINRRHEATGDDDGTSPNSARRPAPQFKTDGGRIVLGGGGVAPDVALPHSTIASADTAFEHAIGTKVPQFRDALTSYAVSLKVAHGVSTPAFTVTPEMRAELFK